MLNTITATNISNRGGEETPEFVLHLLQDGKPIAVVTNNGRGGSHTWWPHPDAPSGTFRPFKDAFEAAAAVALGLKYENGDMVVTGFLYGAPDAAKAASTMKAELAAYGM